MCDSSQRVGQWTAERNGCEQRATCGDKERGGDEANDGREDEAGERGGVPRDATSATNARSADVFQALQRMHQREQN